MVGRHVKALADRLKVIDDSYQKLADKAKVTAASPFKVIKKLYFIATYLYIMNSIPNQSSRADHV